MQSIELSYARYKFYGKVSVKAGRVEMQSPVFDTYDQDKNTGKIIPIYPSIYELTQNTLKSIMQKQSTAREN